jgi:hypothetical protein
VPAMDRDESGPRAFFLSGGNRAPNSRKRTRHTNVIGRGQQAAGRPQAQRRRNRERSALKESMQHTHGTHMERAQMIDDLVMT